MKDNFKIWCETNEQRDAVLEELEHMNIKWAEGQKATEWDLVSDAPIGLAIEERKIVEVVGKDFFEFAHFCKSLKEIKAEDFLKVNECIVIYRKDNEVIALDKRTGNRGVAKCNPVDEFNFETGAKLAFERLMPPEEPKVYNGKFVVTAPAKDLTVGRIYEIKDGYFTNDEGKRFPLSTPIEDSNDLRDYFLSSGLHTRKRGYNWMGVKFIEVVE